MWAELGIEPTTDERAIRRAYVARLKAIRADIDPQTFIRLRDAYEKALRQRHDMDEEGDRGADWRSDGHDPDATSSPSDRHVAGTELGAENCDEEDLSAENACAGDSLVRIDPLPFGAFEEFEKAFNAAISSNQTLLALRVFDSAMARGVVPLGREQFLITPLVECALNDLTLSASAFQDVVLRFGLDSAIQATGTMVKLADRGRARVAANTWYANLLADADRWAVGWAKQPSLSARILLRRLGKIWFHGVDENVLRRRIVEYKRHAVWISNAPDPAWIESVERRLRRYAWRRRVRKHVFWALFWTLWILGILSGIMFPPPPH